MKMSYQTVRIYKARISAPSDFRRFTFLGECEIKDFKEKVRRRNQFLK